MQNEIEIQEQGGTLNQYFAEQHLYWNDYDIDKFLPKKNLFVSHNDVILCSKPYHINLLILSYIYLRGTFVE